MSLHLQRSYRPIFLDETLDFKKNTVDAQNGPLPQQKRRPKNGDTPAILRDLWVANVIQIHGGSSLKPFPGIFSQQNIQKPISSV